MRALEPVPVDTGFRPSATAYVAIGLVAGAIIALQIVIMRIFAVGSWAHFGSLVVSLAMLGFGLTSVVLCIAKSWFERHWQPVITGSLLAFGPLIIASNLAAQQVPFNAIFIVSDPNQLGRLVANFLLYLTPFLAGALFLGTLFLKAQAAFARVYFADLTGSGLCGLAVLVAMYLLRPEHLIVVPLALWFVGTVFWFVALGERRALTVLMALGVLSLAVHLVAPERLGLTRLAVSDYKGVAYARKFPDSRLVYERTSPFGHVEVYASSYLHFAPGLSDNAAFNLPNMPSNAYLGLYVDGEGPSGVIARLPPEQTGYYRFLPMFYPYLLRPNAEAFVVQFGGGLSTALALASTTGRVTVAESNPAILAAFRTDPFLREFTGDRLADPRLDVVDYDGRLFLAGTTNRYGIIDLSLADSAGLSSPGGFAIVEKYGYTREAMANYMRALADGGILAVTLWNKEEPPKSILKLYATMALAAGDVDAATVRRSFFVVSSYLSTATVLYRRGGFTDEEIVQLRRHTRAMSFDEIYYPGMEFDPASAEPLLAQYRATLFGDGSTAAPSGEAQDPTGPGSDPTGPGGEATEAGPEPPPAVLPATAIGRLAWHRLINGGFAEFQRAYVFDTRPLTNDRPYFAAYVKVQDLPHITDRLEHVQDEWGYLLLWATLGVAGVAALLLIAIPVAFGWRAIFSRYPGKGRTILYFACLGAGYIMVEVGLIAHFTSVLSNATVSASVLITGMLVFSGIGAFVSERIIDDARRVMPMIFVAIAAFLFGYGVFLDRILDALGALPYAARLAACFALVFPPAFLMGLPMPTAMGWLSRLGKDHMFVWAWGINGCFSVVGAAAVPLIGTSFGLSSVLLVSGLAYLVAIPAFFAVLRPIAPRAAGGLTAAPA
jgi:hypothetical protein